MENLVSIPKERLAQLIRTELEFDALEYGGVDNWINYDYALDEPDFGDGESFNEMNKRLSDDDLVNEELSKYEWIPNESNKFSIIELLSELGSENKIDSGTSEKFDVTVSIEKDKLRPISSMTKEEIDKLFEILDINKDGEDEGEWIKINDIGIIRLFTQNGKDFYQLADAVNYLDSIGINYRD